MEAERNLKKILDDLSVAAETSAAAEAAYKDEVAATHLGLNAPSDATAFNLGSFMGMDVDKIVVDLGPDFVNLTPSDAGVLKTKVDLLIADIHKHVQATIGPLKELVDKAKATITEANESAAKKRKGEDGSVTVVPSPSSPATHTCGSGAASSVSPASPSPAEKDAVAADKKAAAAADAAAAAAETAALEAAEAKAAAVEKEKTAREDKVARDGQIALAVKGGTESHERKAALLKRESEMTD